MSPISQPRSVYDRDPSRFDRDATCPADAAPPFGTDWAFDDALAAVGAAPDADLGFVSDWALPAAADRAR